MCWIITNIITRCVSSRNVYYFKHFILKAQLSFSSISTVCFHQEIFSCLAPKWLDLLHVNHARAILVFSPLRIYFKLYAYAIGKYHRTHTHTHTHTHIYIYIYWITYLCWRDKISFAIRWTPFNSLMCRLYSILFSIYLLSYSTSCYTA